MKQSAGILAYRFKNHFQFFLVHPGGPYFKNKQAGVWTIPKGEFDETEEPLVAAKREFLEETGFDVQGDFIALKPITQKAGKVVFAWALQFDINEAMVISNTFLLEWPPRSGLKKEFREIDEARWFSYEEAKEKINPAQVAFLDELLLRLNGTASNP